MKANGGGLYEMQENIDPLAPQIWFERIEIIADGKLASTENSLRHALHLLQLTPRKFRPAEYWAIDEKSYEEQLARGDFDAAARHLVAVPTLAVSIRSNAGGVEVAIRCETRNRTIFGMGESVAAAILQAWAKCLLALRAGEESSWLNAASTH